MIQQKSSIDTFLESLAPEKRKVTMHNIEFVLSSTINSTKVLLNEGLQDDSIAADELCESVATASYSLFIQMYKEAIDSIKQALKNNQYEHAINLYNTLTEKFEHVATLQISQDTPVILESGVAFLRSELEQLAREFPELDSKNREAVKYREEILEHIAKLEGEHNQISITIELIGIAAKLCKLVDLDTVDPLYYKEGVETIELYLRRGYEFKDVINEAGISKFKEAQKRCSSTS